ncbi:hypothetical protein BDW75DRAFT_247554 [Aspergillus navahoensis]
MVVNETVLPVDHYIHGKWTPGASATKLALRSAVDDTIVTENLTCANAADVEAAVQPAETALPVWQALGPGKQRVLLNTFAQVIEENSHRLAYLESIVVGKPLSMGTNLEVPNLAELFRYFAGFIDKIDGDMTFTEDGFLRGVIHQPLGVCAAIIPFNSPLITFGMKVAPALATGNVVIVKPSEFNPLSALALGELASKAGIPYGVINVISGAGEAGAALSSHPRIRKISFTGSPVIGRHIQVAAARSSLKRVTLELGGKSPVLIFRDARLENAVQHAMSYVVFNGQGCCLGTRIMVEDAIAEQFVRLLKEKSDAFAATLGSDPMDPKTASSPLYHHKQRDSVVDFLESGATWSDKGCYILPTIFYKPQPGADVTFHTESEAIERANQTEYGLGGYIFTESIDRALRLTKALEVGTIGVNTSISTHTTLPFRGWKGSGIGTENTKYVLRAYTQPKSIAMQ